MTPEQSEALRALLAAPFIVALIVLAISATLHLTYREYLDRKNRS